MVWITGKHFPGRPGARPTLIGGALALALPASGLAAQQAGPDRLADMDLEELMDVRITSVSRRGESLSSAAASIFVITADDIRRSGYQSLPEVLRLAPNLQVARQNANEYAITARGFNNAVGNKLLVLIDGRTAYLPLFSGVFWEMQDTLLADIERIEVISGPGATLWGANAVNGVINVITRDSADTQGTLLSAAYGNNDYRAVARHGGRTDGGITWRLWGKVRDRDKTRGADGTDFQDDWHTRQAGFRVDWQGSDQHLTVQGDLLRGETSDRSPSAAVPVDPLKVRNGNLLARWTRQLDGGSELRVQAYWKQSLREDDFLFSPESDIIDLEFQHHVSAGRHEVVWGGGYRYAEDRIEPGFGTVYIPEHRHLDWQNLYIQDEIAVGDRLRITPGLKLEWNDYTGMEYMPSVRASWQLDADNLVWGALSRAVRAPARFDRDVYFPAEPPFLLTGGPEFKSEVAKVTELGYRGEVGEALNYSVTLYHHNWDDLRSGSPPPTPVFLVNNIEGEAYGLEAWANWHVSENWRLNAGVTTLEKNLRFRHGLVDTVGTDNDSLHNDPAYQWQLRSSTDLSHDWSVDLRLRHVAELEVQSVPGYTELDAWLGWRPTRGVEVSLSGQNLLDGSHPEYGEAGFRSEIERSLIVGVEWSL